MKTILIFLPCLTYGGAERQGFAVAQHLKSEGYRVTVWGFPSPSGQAPLKNDLDSAGIAWYEIAAWPTLDWTFSRLAIDSRWSRERFWGWSKQLATQSAKLPAERFDVVIPFTFWPCLIATLCLAARAGVVLWNHRGGDHDAGIDYSPFLVTQIKTRQPVFIANSQGGGAFLRRVFAVPDDKVAIIPNVFVPEVVFRKDDRRWHTPSNTIRLLHIANFFPEKDVETLVRACPLFADISPRIELHLVGYFPDPAQEAGVRQLCAELGADATIIFRGSLDRHGVTSLLRTADIGLLSSRSEGAPNAVLEYMYFCLPIVGTDIPGIRELLAPSNAQRLFPVGDAQALAARVRALATNPNLRLQLGAQNRTRLEETYVATRIFPMWSNLIGRLVGS